MSDLFPVLPILAVCPNPAMQRTLEFERFRPGSVNRALSVCTGIGGKGVNCAVAANTVKPGSAAVAYFADAGSGRVIQERLHLLGTVGVQATTQAITRSCTTILSRCDASMTELIDPSGRVSGWEVAEMLERIRELMPGVQAVALCGTRPPGVDDSFYAEIAEMAGSRFVLLDACGGIEPTLATGKVDLIKINREELREMTGAPSPADGAAICLREFRVGAVAVTDGPHTAYMFTDRCTHEFWLPVLENQKSPLGAGDTVNGVLLARILEGVALSEALAWGLAAASASCLTAANAAFSCAEMQRIHEEIKIKEGVRTS